MTGGTALRSALLALLALAVLSGGGFAAGDLFDDDYADCPHGTRMREGQIADLTAARDAEERDQVNVAWTTTDPATWGLGPNTYNTSLVVILDDGGDLDTRTVSLGTGKATFTDVGIDTEVKVQMAIVADTPNGAYLISDILETNVNPNLPAPSFTTRLGFLVLPELVEVSNGTFYYVGYNENFGNYKATGLTTIPRTARLRIGLAHGIRQELSLTTLYQSLRGSDGVSLYDSVNFVPDNADFDAYVVRITDEDGDVLPGGDNVATMPTGTPNQWLRVWGIDGRRVGELTDNDRVLSNVRLNDGGRISVAVQNLSSLPAAAGPISPEGLSLFAVGIPGSQAVALFPDEHRDFPIDMLASDETYKITAWAVNRGKVISSAASLTVHPTDKKTNISSITDYANAGGTAVTNVYVTEFTVFK